MKTQGWTRADLQGELQRRRRYPATSDDSFTIPQAVTVAFEPEGPDGYEHATFHVTQAERSAVNSVIEVLRMQAGTITALAIEIVLKDFAEVLPADVRKRMNDEIEKFKAAIAERARKSKRLGMELCEANGIKPVTR